jgi:D-alanyl-D-alanine carboxypeptidase
MHDASGGLGPRSARTTGARLAGFARTPAGIGVLVVVALTGVIAVGGVIAGASGSAGGVAAASPSASVSTALLSDPPTAAPAAAPTSASSPVPDPTPSAAPSPSASFSTVPTDAATAKVLQARLDSIRKKLKVPGVSVAILWDDGREWLGASGMSDVGAGDPMTTATAFALASVSKTTTAAVVLQLVEEGRLSLDQKVAPLLPAFDMNPKITVRQLLDHTSGLPDFFLNAKIERQLRKDKNAAWTAERTWAYVPDKRPKPGKFWIYSNSNYLLLGELVTAVTGRPLAAEVRERLLDPLDLESAWFQAEEDPRAEGTVAYRLVAASGGGVRAVPVARKSDVMPFRSVVTAAGGAGSLAATAEDAARWMQAFAGGDVLTPAMQREMLADVARTSTLKPRLPYGLGIQALPIAGRYALGHSGRFLGFRNVVRYLPAEGVTISVLTNQGAKDPTKIAEALLKVVLPPLPAASPSASGPAAP